MDALALAVIHVPVVLIAHANKLYQASPKTVSYFLRQENYSSKDLQG